MTSDLALSLSRSSSGHERPGRGHSPSPGPQPPDVSTGSQHRLCPDSGIASIEDRSPSTDLVTTCLSLASDKCNGRLQRTGRVDEAEPPGRLSETEEEEEPLMTSAASLVVPGLQPTQNRCHVQTSGWL